MKSSELKFFIPIISSNFLHFNFRNVNKSANAVKNAKMLKTKDLQFRTKQYEFRLTILQHSKGFIYLFLIYKILKNNVLGGY